MADINSAIIERYSTEKYTELVVELDCGLYRWTNNGVGKQIKRFMGPPDISVSKSDQWIASLARNAGIEVSDFEIKDVVFARNVGYVNMTDEEIDAEIKRLEDESQQGESAGHSFEEPSQENTEDQASADIQRKSAEPGKPEEGGQGGLEIPSYLGQFPYLKEGPESVDGQLNFTIYSDYDSIIGVTSSGKEEKAERFQSFEISPGYFNYPLDLPQQSESMVRPPGSETYITIHFSDMEAGEPVEIFSGPLTDIVTDGDS